MANAQFAKVWAIKSNVRQIPGDTIAVNLKSGATKHVKLGSEISEVERKDGSKYYLYSTTSEE